jgi:hypothetical protein
MITNRRKKKKCFIYNNLGRGKTSGEREGASTKNKIPEKDGKQHDT